MRGRPLTAPELRAERAGSPRRPRAHHPLPLGGGRVSTAAPQPPSLASAEPREGGAMEMKKRINLELRNQAPEEVSGAGVRPRSRRPRLGPTPVPPRFRAVRPRWLRRIWVTAVAQEPRGAGWCFRAALRAVPRGLEVGGGAGFAPRSAPRGAFIAFGFSLSGSLRPPSVRNLRARSRRSEFRLQLQPGVLPFRWRGRLDLICLLVFSLSAEGGPGAPPRCELRTSRAALRRLLLLRRFPFPRKLPLNNAIDHNIKKKPRVRRAGETVEPLRLKGTLNIGAVESQHGWVGGDLADPLPVQSV